MTKTLYALYPCFRASSGFRDLDADDAAQEVENLFKEWDSSGVAVRGVYSTRAFRADTDLMLWLLGPSPDSVQDALIAFGRTEAGRRLETVWTFMGVVKPAEFTSDHAGIREGQAPKRYACVYPFVRTPEWYLLPREERAALLREHGEVGREFPDVLANTTSAFGIGDWEWILAFEADALDRIVDCIRRLREAEARRFTKVEIPFVTGIRKDTRSAFADLV
jgi:chlorite dismutase